MGSGAKCNQTSCDNPAAFRFTWPGQDEAGVCLEHERRVRQVAEAMGCSVQLIPLQESADPPDPESVKCKNEVLCAIDKSNGLHEDECTTIISRYLQKAREEERRYQSNRFAIAHIHECAVKAFQALENATWLDHDRRSTTDHKDNIVRIICQAFGAPAIENEQEEMFEREWAKHDPYSHPLPNPTEGFTKAISRKMFQAAWKLAKGDK